MFSQEMEIDLDMHMTHMGSWPIFTKWNGNYLGLAFKPRPNETPQPLCFLKRLNTCFSNLVGFKFEASPVAVPIRSCKDVGPEEEDKRMTGRGGEETGEKWQYRIMMYIFFWSLNALAFAELRTSEAGGTQIVVQ